MMLRKMAASAGLAVGLAMAGWGVAATAGTAAAGASTATAHASPVASRIAPVSSQDRMFMNQASQINLAEISLSRYVLAHASTATARNVAARYVRDHTAAQASLRILASDLHVILPATPGVQHETMAARVEAQKGRNLDITFTKAVVPGHQTAIAIFKKEVSAGSNPAVKAYAARYLPVLRTHLSLAQHANSTLRVTP